MRSSFNRCLRQTILAVMALLLAASCGHRPAAAGDEDLSESPTADGPLVSRDAGPGAQLDSRPPQPDATMPCQYKRLTAAEMLSPPQDGTSTPTVAFAGQRFGVAWLRSATRTVQLRRVDTQGKPVGQEISAGPNSFVWPELGSDGARFGLCWHSQGGANQAMSFRTIDPASGALGAATKLSGYSACHGVVHDAAQGRWLLMMRGASNAGDALYRYGLARIDAQSGKLQGPIDPILELDTMQYIALASRGGQPTIARLASDIGANSFRRVVVNVVGGPAKPINTSGQEGNASSPRLLRLGSASSAPMALLYLEERAFWGWPGAFPQVLYLQHLNSDGSPKGTRVALTASNELTTSFAVAHDGATLLVLRMVQRQLDVGARGPAPHETRVQLLQLDDDGKERAAPLELGTVIEKKPSVGYPRLAVDRQTRTVLGVWNQLQSPGSIRSVYHVAAGCR